MALLKKLMDRVDGNSQVAIAGNLDRLIREAHSEHQTLQALITRAESRDSQVPRLNDSLDETARRAAALADQLESLAARIQGLEAVHHQVQSVEARIASLEGGVRKAEDRIEQALARETHLQEDRKAVEAAGRAGTGNARADRRAEIRKRGSG